MATNTTLRLLCVVAALAALVSAAVIPPKRTPPLTQDFTELPQNTDADIVLDLFQGSPCVSCSYCISYNLPMFGKLNVNVSFISSTTLNADVNFMGQDSRCTGITYRVDSGPKQLVIPTQSTDCIGLIVLSYAEPVSAKLGLDRHVRDGLRKWMTTLNQCAGSRHP